MILYLQLLQLNIAKRLCLKIVDHDSKSIALTNLTTEKLFTQFFAVNNAFESSIYMSKFWTIGLFLCNISDYEIEIV